MAKRNRNRRPLGLGIALLVVAGLAMGFVAGRMVAPSASVAQPSNLPRHYAGPIASPFAVYNGASRCAMVAPATVACDNGFIGRAP